MTAPPDRGSPASDPTTPPTGRGAPPSGPGGPPSDRWREVRRRIDAVEARLRRGRLTVPTYLAATAFFLIAGFVTGNWPPAAVLAALCLLAAWFAQRVRRTRTDQLRALEELEASLPGGSEDEEGGGRDGSGRDG